MPIITARNIGIERAGAPLLRGLDFTIAPGLSLVRGGDGRGKTTLLRLLAGTLQPTGGQLDRSPCTVFWIDPQAPRDDQQVVQAWLQARRAEHPAWSDAVADALVRAFGLEEHLHKGLFMLSAGTWRKVVVVAAMASGAGLTLLDTPFAAMDGRGRAILADLLDEASGHGQRAFVVADYELPPGMAREQLAGVIDLGQ